MRVLMLAVLCSFTLFQASGAQEAPTNSILLFTLGLTWH